MRLLKGSRKLYRVGTYLKKIKMEERQRLIDESARTIKELAADQKIQIQLTPEQYAALEEGWKAYDHSQPAQITFVVNGKNEAELKVAAYTYRSTTCCA